MNKYKHWIKIDSDDPTPDFDKNADELMKAIIAFATKEPASYIECFRFGYTLQKSPKINRYGNQQRDNNL